MLFGIFSSRKSKSIFTRNFVTKAEFKQQTEKFRKNQQRRALMTAGGLITAVLAIYFYTFHAISSNDFAEYENDRRITPLSKNPNPPLPPPDLPPNK